MKKFIFGTLVFLGMIQNAFAALPPFYESLAELNALLKDPRLADRLGSGELITSIQKNDQGWQVTTTHYNLQIDVVYQKTELIGPQKFELRFQDAKSK